MYGKAKQLLNGSTVRHICNFTLCENEMTDSNEIDL